MAHSELLRRLRALSRLAHADDAADLDYDQALAQQHSRRAALKLMGAAGALAAASALPRPVRAVGLGNGNQTARIAIVGGGLAGLACAYELQKAGLTATVYEAATRLGGRCFSNRGSFPGQVAENGGELIDTYQVEIQRLAHELGLELDDLAAYDASAGGEELYRFEGYPYTVAEAYEDFKAIQKQLDFEVAKAPFPTRWDSYTERGYALDHMSITDWINHYVPGGIGSRLGRLLDVAYEIEYGAACAEQSALSLIYLLGYSKQRSLDLFGESDERYHIRGGNDQLVSGMAARVGEEQLRLQHELKALRRNADGVYTLSFDTDGRRVEIDADQVVLALPFSLLRHGVDYQAAGFDARKRLAIQTMPMGNNCKFQLQFDRRLWREQGGTGVTYTDTGYQNTWEVTRAQAGAAGIINNFTGGATALAMNNRPPAQKAQEFLAQFEAFVPGIGAQWNGRLVLNYWPGYRWTRGAYAYYAVGDYTAFCGHEGERQGNCHFCGEHTSVESQGYLNGAVETGQRCATEIIGDLKGQG